MKSKISKKIVFAYVSEHCAFFGTKKILARFGEGGGSKIYMSLSRTWPCLILKTTRFSDVTGENLPLLNKICVCIFSSGVACFDNMAHIKLFLFNYLSNLTIPSVKKVMVSFKNRSTDNK